MKPLTLSFLVLSSIVLFAVLATCEDCHKQFDEEIKNSSSGRVLSWVNEIIGNDSSTLVDSLEGEPDSSNMESVKRMIIGPFGEFNSDDTLDIPGKSKDSVIVDVQRRYEKTLSIAPEADIK
jgi:hypothetical protein